MKCLNDDIEGFLEFRKSRLIGQQTGIKGLDNGLLGITGITGIQGHPGSCKSTLALQIAAYNAAKGSPVFFYDRENGFKRLQARLYCHLTKTSWTDMLVSPTEEIMQGLSEHKEVLKLFYSEVKPIDRATIRQNIENLKARHGVLPIFVVDSIQAAARATMMLAGAQDEKAALEMWLEFLDQLKLDYQNKLLIVITSEKTKDKFSGSSLSAGKGTASIAYKSEILLDLDYNEKSNSLNITCVKARDGITNFSVSVFKHLTSPDNEASFCFNLVEGGFG